MGGGPLVVGCGARSAAMAGAAAPTAINPAIPSKIFFIDVPNLTSAEYSIRRMSSAWSASVGPQKRLSRPPNQSKIRPQYSRFTEQGRLRNATLHREVLTSQATES